MLSVINRDEVREGGLWAHHMSDAQPAQVRQGAGEILVQFAAGASAAARQAALSGIGGEVVEVVRGARSGEVGEGTLSRVRIGQGLSVEQAIEIISKQPGVRFAEPNFTYSITALSDDPGYSGGHLWGLYGDQTDPVNQFGSQAGEAWRAGHIGSSLVVAGVVDTGIDYTHPDLYLNVWLNQSEIPIALFSALTDADGDGQITFRDLNNPVNAAFASDIDLNGRIDAGDLLQDSRWENGVDEDRNGYVDDLIGWDFANNDNDPFDDQGHGTHVSGTIAALGGNGIGVAGVSWSTQLMALKFLNSEGSGRSSDAIKALDYFTAASGAASLQKFAATNNSWGGGGFSQSLLDAIVRGARQDILFVAAAGNGGSDQLGDNNDLAPVFPANYDTTAAAGYNAVISVGALTRDGTLASFSNYGAQSVHLAAPGHQIVSTLPGGRYGTFSGTSMAAPHVTGAIALHAAIAGKSAAGIREDLLASALATASLDGKTSSGGRLNSSGLVERALTGDGGSNEIQGGGEADTIKGLGGDDKLGGGEGADTIFGGAGNDQMFGHGGNDETRGQGGLDLIDGGYGDDRLFGGPGDDTIGGGEGNDQLYGGADQDRLRGGAGDDEIRGMFGNDLLFGDDGNDRIFGGPGMDTLQGGVGHDTLRGGADGDFLFGEDGNDIIIGELGQDELTGGAGDDVFEFWSVSTSPTGAADRILDFGDGQDKIDLSAIDADITAEGNQSFSFIGTSVFTAAGQIRAYEDPKQAGKWIVEGDVDGDGSADFQIDVFVTAGQNALSAVDFVF